MRHFRELPPLSIYIHLPWCLKKCPYCDFNSHEKKAALPETDYVQALLRDLEQEMPDVWGRTIASVFIGGGTPSLFSANALDQLLSGVRALTGLSPDTEVTLEANPGTFEQEKFSEFRALGINRLSIGIQSFNDESLHALGRVHNSDEASRAVDIAHNAGFDRINLDLMFGLPRQSASKARADVVTAIAMQPEHISYYELTLEPNTLFAKYPPDLPSPDSLEHYQNTGMELLDVAGYQRYEVSAFAQPKRRCTHNLNYWQFGDYLGIGAGAHGKISFANTGTIVRRSKHKHPTRYLALAESTERISTEQTLAEADTALEFMMNALRLKEGFPIPLFEQHTGLSLDRWQNQIESAQQAGLLTQSGLSIHPTDTGFRFLNDLLGHFLVTGSDPAGSDPSGSDQTGSDLERSYPVIPLVRQPDRH
ncbi:MAG: radical SAM family heme chaperone HemW [Gammaproteobacteria bacterium]|nr:radical SAM family heme chaperone HemW [Gammaproteobacteria bacterium]